SALLAHALMKLGAKPSYAIGALVPQWPAHARDSGGDTSWFVAEVDESDGSLKEFKPEHAILLNVDAEHLDHFPDLDAVCREFATFADNTRDSIIFCGDDPRLAELMSKQSRAISYGFNPLAQYRIHSDVAQPSTPSPQLS